jgi:hypothetical protein
MARVGGQVKNRLRAHNSPGNHREWFTLHSGGGDGRWGTRRKFDEDFKHGVASAVRTGASWKTIHLCRHRASGLPVADCAHAASVFDVGLLRARVTRPWARARTSEYSERLQASQRSPRNAINPVEVGRADELPAAGGEGQVGKDHRQSGHDLLDVMTSEQPPHSQSRWQP